MRPTRSRWWGGNAERGDSARLEAFSDGVLAIEQLRARLPASVAIVEELPSACGADPETERWFRVELHAERLDWLPPLLASLDRPFVVERPDELRDLIATLAGRLAASVRRNAPHQ